MRVVIFANGVLNEPQHTQNHLQADDFLIAADGGALHCLDLGLIPHIVIGDFDSLDPQRLSQLSATGSQLIRHPARKDSTDLELALAYACQLQPDRVLIFGALGNRWDQTLANLLLPASKEFASLDIRLVDGQQEIFLIRSGQTIEIGGNPGDTLSLVPLGGDATGISTQGLEYALIEGDLFFGSTRGISNVLLENKAVISCREGLLVGVLIHTAKPMQVELTKRSR